MKNLVISFHNDEDIDEKTIRKIKKLLYEISDKNPDMDVLYTTEENSELISRNF